jgi:hypothetical protein
VNRVAQLRETGNGVYTLQYTFRLITDRNGEDDDDDIEIIKATVGGRAYIVRLPPPFSHTALLLLFFPLAGLQPG